MELVYFIVQDAQQWADACDALGICFETTPYADGDTAFVARVAETAAQALVASYPYGDWEPASHVEIEEACLRGWV